VGDGGQVQHALAIDAAHAQLAAQLEGLVARRVLSQVGAREDALGLPRQLERQERDARPAGEPEQPLVHDVRAAQHRHAATFMALEPRRRHRREQLHGVDAHSAS
jgi:hypothetical protein